MPILPGARGRQSHVPATPTVYYQQILVPDAADGTLDNSSGYYTSPEIGGILFHSVGAVAAGTTLLLLSPYNTMATPAGWSRIVGVSNCRIFWRTADGTSADDFASDSGTNELAGLAVDPFATLDDMAQSIFANTSLTTPNPNAGTALQRSDDILWCGWWASASISIPAITAPGGFTTTTQEAYDSAGNVGYRATSGVQTLSTTTPGAQTATTDTGTSLKSFALALVGT